MSANRTKWTPYYPRIPTLASANPLDILRQNIKSVFWSTATSVAPMVNYTNSVTRGEASPGTAAHPLRKYWWYQPPNVSENERRWAKAVFTYTGLDTTKIAMYYSSDNESNYVPMLDENGNYVMTLTYDGSNNLTSTTWGNTP